MDQSSARAGIDRARAMFLAYRSVAGLFALLVLVQAVLAGQFLNGRGGLVTAHRALGAQVLPSLSLALVILAILLPREIRPSALMVVATALLGLTVLQTGLGFLGRNNLKAAGWHIPLGVTIFGLAVYNVSIVRSLAIRQTT